MNKEMLLVCSDVVSVSYYSDDRKAHLIGPSVHHLFHINSVSRFLKRIKKTLSSKLLRASNLHIELLYKHEYSPCTFCTSVFMEALTRIYKTSTHHTMTKCDADEKIMIITMMVITITLARTITITRCV